MNNKTRVEKIEKRTPIPQRIFIIRGEEITENGETRTQKDIDEAERQGFAVLAFRIVYTTKEVTDAI